MGDYTRPNGTTAMNDHSVADEGIPSVEFDDEFNGLVTEVNKMWPKDGSEAMTGPLKLKKGSDVASQTALFTAGGFPTDGNYFDVTGTTGITSILTSSNVGTVIMLHFDDIVTLTHHATDLVLPGGQNITTVAGDELTFVEYASGDWRLIGRTIIPTDYLTPAGAIVPYSGFTAPTGWLLCDGSAISRTAYPTLYALHNPNIGPVTMTIASPGVFTAVGHGLGEGDAVFFTTTGALPTGLTATTTRYFVIAAGLSADNFQVSATYGGAAVNTSVSQSGVHTLHRSPFGVGDGSTTFNVPDMRGRFALGKDNMGGNSADRVVATQADAVGAASGSEFPATHTHGVSGSTAVASGGTTYQHGTTDAFDVANDQHAHSISLTSAASGSAVNQLNPYITFNYIIKY